MSTFKVYQQANTVLIENTLTQEVNYISIQDFSFEIDYPTSTIQLVDSSIEKKVEEKLDESKEGA